MELTIIAKSLGLNVDDPEKVRHEIELERAFSEVQKKLSTARVNKISSSKKLSMKIQYQEDKIRKVGKL